MKSLVATSALIAAFLPSTLLAESLSFGGSVTVTSNPLSDGFSETENAPAIQTYLEISKNSFYAEV